MTIFRNALAGLLGYIASGATWLAAKIRPAPGETPQGGGGNGPIPPPAAN